SGFLVRGQERSRNRCASSSRLSEPFWKAAIISVTSVSAMVLFSATGLSQDGGGARVVEAVPAIDVLLYFLKRLPITAAPLRISLRPDHLSGHEPAAQSVSRVVVVVAFPMPAASPGHAGLYRDVYKDALDPRVAGRAQSIDAPLRGFP